MKKPAIIISLVMTSSVLMACGSKEEPEPMLITNGIIQGEEETIDSLDSEDDTEVNAEVNTEVNTEEELGVSIGEENKAAKALDKAPSSQPEIRQADPAFENPAIEKEASEVLEVLLMNNEIANYSEQGYTVVNLMDIETIDNYTCYLYGVGKVSADGQFTLIYRYAGSSDGLNMYRYDDSAKKWVKI